MKYCIFYMETQYGKPYKPVLAITEDHPFVWLKKLKNFIESSSHLDAEIVLTGWKEITDEEAALWDSIVSCADCMADVQKSDQCPHNPLRSCEVKS